MVRCAVTLVIDHLRASALGSYGAAWCDTPAWNRFASQALVCDQAHVETLDLPGIYRSLWTGQHASLPDSAVPALPERLASADVATVLLTDDETLVHHPLAASFDECHLLAAPPHEGVVEHVGETQVANFFAAAASWLGEPPLEDCCLWLHSRGLAARWDAPLEFRNRLADPEDPSPPDTREPPRERLPLDHDPDRVLGFTQAYAGQVIALDECLAGLLAQGEQSGWTEQALWIVTGCRGFPLGEHLRLGWVDESLFGEATHVPLLIRPPQTNLSAVRCLELVAPGDVTATLADWFGLPAQSTVDPHQAVSLLPRRSGSRALIRPYLYQTSSSDRAVRTPHWFYRMAVDGSEEGLYVKPDDRWEANEVSDRCRQAAKQLRATAEACAKVLRQDGPPTWPTLPEDVPPDTT